MRKEFKVVLGDTPVGTVVMRRQGCFYSVECICSVPMDDRYKLVLHSDSTEIDLGLCVSYDHGFGLKTHIKIGEAEIHSAQFALISASTIFDGAFYPVQENQTFDKLEYLESGVLQVRDGKLGIVLKTKG